MVDFLGSLGSANPWALYAHDSGALCDFQTNRQSWYRYSAISRGTFDNAAHSSFFSRFNVLQRKRSRHTHDEIHRRIREDEETTNTCHRQGGYLEKDRKRQTHHDITSSFCSTKRSKSVLGEENSPPPVRFLYLLPPPEETNRTKKRNVRVFASGRKDTVSHTHINNLPDF